MSIAPLVRSLVLMQRSQTSCWQAKSAAASSSRSGMPPPWYRLGLEFHSRPPPPPKAHKQGVQPPVEPGVGAGGGLFFGAQRRRRRRQRDALAQFFLRQLLIKAPCAPGAGNVLQQLPGGGAFAVAGFVGQ